LSCNLKIIEIFMDTITHSTPQEMATPATSDTTLLSALHWRYATKVFDPAKKLSTAQWATLEEALVLTPSSYGLQPWRFVDVVDKNIREQLKPASWGQPQTTDASHFVVFAARTKIDANDIEHYVNYSAQRQGIPASALDQYKQMMIGDVVNGPRSQWAAEWAARQCYIALGNLMTSAAILGIDTCPMEGIDPVAYDKILNLPAIGYKTVVACAVGYRSTTDKYAAKKKVRYPSSQVILKK
jgi:nitroreductase